MVDIAAAEIVTMSKPITIIILDPVSHLSLNL